MRAYLNRKLICKCVFILFIISIIPLLLIARYDHPSADDFSYGNHTVSTWQGTGSIIQTLMAAKNGTEAIYNSWQGSFSAVFLMTLQPAVFNENLYALVPLILLLGFMAATMFLLKIILIDYLEADKYSYGIISMIVVFLSMQFLVSPVSAFYWYNGAMYYTGFYSLAVLLFAIILLANKTNTVPLKAVYAAFVLILSFLIGGSNFVVSLTSSVVMALFLAYRLIFKRNNWLIPLLGLFTLSSALLISAIAPGNAIRQESFSNMPPLSAIFFSFWYALKFALFFVPKPVYFAFAFIVSLIYKAVQKSTYSFRLPGVVTALLYGVYASTFTPNLYAMSSFGPERVANTNYYTFLLFLLFSTIYWCGWIAKKVPPAYVPSSKDKKRSSKKEELPVEVGLNGLLAVCFILGCLIVSDYNINTIMSVSATRSLVTGEAKTYHEEYLSRISLYKNSEIKQIELSTFTAKPYVLYFDDVVQNPDDWRNTALANFYKKDSVLLID